MTDQNRSIGFYEGGLFIPNVHDSKALAGYDKLNDKFYFYDADDDGRFLVRNMVVDPDTLEWVNQEGGSSGVSADVNVMNWPAIQPVSGPLTDAELRDTPVPVSGTFWPTTQPVSGPLTDTELRNQDVKITLDSEQVKADPMTDYDVAISYLASKIQQIVITGYGQTKTMIIGWTGDDLTSITTTIT